MIQLKITWENDYYACFAMPPNKEGLLSFEWDKSKQVGWLVHASGGRFPLVGEYVTLRFRV